MIIIVIVYPTRSVCPKHFTSCRGGGRSVGETRGRQEVVSQNSSAVPVQAVHRASLSAARRRWSLRRDDDGAAGPASQLVTSKLPLSPRAPLARAPLARALTQPTRLLSVTLPLLHRHCQELHHILCFFLFLLKVRLSLKRKVLRLKKQKQNKKKTCFFQPLHPLL